MSKSLLSISKLLDVTESPILGYFIASTAPINVEGDNLPAHKQQVQASRATTSQQAEQNLNQIAEALYKKVSDPARSESNSVELVISTHGFSNSIEATRQRFEEIHSYINRDNSQPFQARASSLMYIGFRWPSEPLVGDNTWWWSKAYHAIVALPILPRIILFFGSFGILFSLIFHQHKTLSNNIFSFFFSVLVLVLTTLFFFVVTLVVLRLLIYFRDYYRATHFGVPDLVELIRQLDKALVSKVKDQHIQHISLVSKLKFLLIQKLKNKLISEGLSLTQQEEPVLEIVCEKVVKSYCKDKAVEIIKIEDLDIQNLGNSIEQDYVNELTKLAEEIITQEKDTKFIKIRERAIEILDNKAKSYWKANNRIKLTFIGHSMGGYVVTSALRILSDVFDLNSVGTLGSTNKLPTSDIGYVFGLERLVLVSPDIPINTILSGRANFLRSSLRRFSETYLFSNEGDLALRLASTVANYFSFPARTRESGYRLGNVAIRDTVNYGIVNLNRVHQKQHQKELLQTLFIDSFAMNKSLAEVQDNFHANETEDAEEIARLFTYFDCTDYTDETTEPNSKQRRLLTLRKWRWEPQWVYYIRLIVAYGLGIKDTHGGYFQGKLSQQTIYGLAFLGFGGFLDSFGQENRKSALEYLSQTCRRNKIQVILSQERYEVDILGCDREQIRRKMLNA
jgi:uncharacterized membrane protein YsdA (DUF1294 family)